MKIAIGEASKSLRSGNHGFGAVIIKGGEIISLSHDEEKTRHDPTFHAELNAIRLASKKLSEGLEGCTIISTHEPCPMCASAIVWSGITNVVFGFSIKDSIKEKRKRIEIECSEIFKRSGAKIAVTAGVLKEECSVLYNESVRKEIKRLRNINKKSLREYSEALSVKRKKWYRENKQRFQNIHDNPLIDAYHIFLEKLEVEEKDAPIVKRTKDKIVIQSMNFCPTLEACKILGLKTAKICRCINEKPTEDLLKEFNTDIRFTRNYDKLRPKSKYCEEIIYLNKNCSA
jgi:tRNA(Arg) A34 adenosine deaminase TadA